jgi:hypothetical protein
VKLGLLVRAGSLLGGYASGLLCGEVGPVHILVEG